MTLPLLGARHSGRPTMRVRTIRDVFATSRLVGNEVPMKFRWNANRQENSPSSSQKNQIASPR
jgi:hypothetical protein